MSVFCRDQLLLQRQNSDSSSDDIPSENDLLQEEVPLLNPEVPEENEQDISSESINANAAEITNDTDQSESSNGPDVPESLDIRDIPEHINSSPESNLSSVEMTDGGNSNASSTSESSNFTLEDFAKDWSLIQMGHHCSNAVAEAFFKFAFEKCELISELKKENGGKIPCLSHLRRKLNEEHVHGIKMDFLFYDLSLCEEERSNNGIHVMNVDVKPQKRYPCDKYLLIYQVAKIEVIYNSLKKNNNKPYLLHYITEKFTS